MQFKANVIGFLAIKEYGMDVGNKNELLDIGLNANVRCYDGDCGNCTFIIIDPVAQRVTHLVVKQDELPCHEHLVPVAWIASSTHWLIQLNRSWEDIEKAETFIEKRFVNPEGERKSAAPFLFLPYVIQKTMHIPVKLKRIPLGELAVSRGAQVLAIDGHAGVVDEFLVDPACGGITHLVVREGHFLGSRAIMVPVSHIQRIEQNNVYININRNELKTLPYLPVWKRFFVESEWRQYKTIETEEKHPRGTETIQTLIDDLSSRDARTREHARSALADSGSTAVRPLKRLLTHKKHQVRWEAAKSLSQMESMAAVPGLITAMDDQEFDVRWIAAEGITALGKKALPYLLKELKLHPDAKWLRESAHHVLRSLMSLEPTPALAPVLHALEEMNPLASLPRAAEETLKELSKLKGNTE